MALDESETTQLIELLGKLDQGELPEAVFHEIARVVALPIVELVPLRDSGNGIEVLMLRRTADDPVWPGLLHTPGTVVRPADTAEGLSSVLERLLEKELIGLAGPEDCEYVATIIHEQARGTECAAVYYVEITDSLGVGEWYRADALPTEMVQTQSGFIQAAAAAYGDDRSNSGPK